MEARPDTSICDFLGEACQVRKAVGHAWSGPTRYRNLGDVLGSQHRLDNARDAAADDAVRAWVFRVHRRVVDWLPSRFTIGGRVVIDIAIANRRDRPPEVVMILGIEHSYERLVEANRCERHKPRAVADTHLFCGYELADERMVSWWTDHEPEPGGLGLLRRTLCTGLAAVLLDLVVVSCPFRALQRNRRSWSKLGCRGHDKWLHVPHFEAAVIGVGT